MMPAVNYSSRNDRGGDTQGYSSLPATKRQLNLGSADAKTYRSMGDAGLVPSDASVERLLTFNQQMKQQISGILETLEGKIHRAKQRKMQEIA